MDRLKYVESLSDDDLRYEMDKVYARLKEIDMFRQVREGLPENYLNPSYDLLEDDFNKLQSELLLYQSIIETRNGK